MPYRVIDHCLLSIVVESIAPGGVHCTWSLLHLIRHCEIRYQRAFLVLTDRFSLIALQGGFDNDERLLWLCKDSNSHRGALSRMLTVSGAIASAPDSHRGALSRMLTVAVQLPVHLMRLAVLRQWYRCCLTSVPNNERFG